MIIFVNRGKVFESAVILRTLYYATGLKNVDVYITGVKNFISFTRYSRTPIEIIKNKVKFEPPKNFKEPVYILDPNSNKKLKDINNIGTLIIDFSGEIHDYPRIKALGISLLHYEAVAAIYELFIRRKKEKEIPDFNQEITRDLIYFARKITEGLIYLDSFPIVSPQLIIRSLRHIYKKCKLIVDSKDINISISTVENNVKLKILLNIYDKNLRKIDEREITLKNNVLTIFLPHNNRIEEFKLFIDYDRRRVYLSKNFFVEDRNLLDVTLNEVFFDNI